MKKTVRWAAASIAFLVVGMLLFLQISEVLRKKAGAGSDMIHGFYEIEENTLDVICIGSSHAYSSFQPNFLWEEYGLTSYVLGSQRQTVATSYYLLLEALQHQQPKVVILETYYMYYTKKYSTEAALRNATDGMRLGTVKLQMIDDILSEFSLEDKLSWYLPFLLYHGRWTELKDYDFNKNLYLKGGIQSYKIKAQEEPELPDTATELSETVTEYLDKIIGLCEEKSIPLVMYAAPYGVEDGDEETFAKRQGVSITLETYLEEENVPFFWYQKENEIGIDFSTDLRDSGHLNSYGAEKVTKALGAYMTENYDLTDHREDADYASWEEDYQKFVEAAADAES